MRVLKFGGTSVDGAERIDRVTSIVREASRHDRVTVVVSALAGVTDLLESALRRALTGAPPLLDVDLGSRHLVAARTVAGNQADEYHHHVHASLEELGRLLEGVALIGECPPTTRDRILATGERLVAPLITQALRCQGLQAETFDGSVLIATGPSGASRIDRAGTRRRAREALAERPIGEIAVVTGFIGGDGEGRTTTLGRGASDYSATVLGAALDAERVEIWTDVDGVLSAEPRMVPQAYPLPYLSYDEAADLACLGARVLHPQTLAPLMAAGIPLFIRNTLRPELAGTRIGEPQDKASGVRAVTALPRVVRFQLRQPMGLEPDVAGLAGLDKPPLLAAWETPGQTLSVIVPEADEGAVAGALASRGSAPPACREELSLVAAVDGSGALLSATAPALLTALAKHDIDVKGLFQPAAAPRSLAVLIDRSAVKSAVRLLHSELVTGARGHPSSAGEDLQCSVH